MIYIAADPFVAGARRFAQEVLYPLMGRAVSCEVAMRRDILNLDEGDELILVPGYHRRLDIPIDWIHTECPAAVTPGEVLIVAAAKRGIVDFGWSTTSRKKK